MNKKLEEIIKNTHPRVYIPKSEYTDKALRRFFSKIKIQADKDKAQDIQGLLEPDTKEYTRRIHGAFVYGPMGRRRADIKHIIRNN